MAKVLLTGDINLMNVEDPLEPFRRIAPILRAADVVMSNLECALYQPARAHAVENEGFYADPEVGGPALTEAGISVVGVANNVNYGEAAILSSLAVLDRFGIPHAGSGENVVAARKPVILEKDGVRYGFLQRSSVYWATNHEASESGVGIAVIRANTAFQVLAHREPWNGMLSPPFNRPGIPPKVVTWVEPDYLRVFAQDVAALRKQCDILVISCHWGLGSEILDYMKEIAHTAIEHGADVVMGHGPHRPLQLGGHQGKPIFYGLGSFSFHTGHLGKKHGDWVGLLAQLTVEDKRVTRTSFSLVRNNDANETVAVSGAEGKATIDRLRTMSAAAGIVLREEGDDFVVLVAAPCEASAVR